MPRVGPILGVSPAAPLLLHSRSCRVLADKMRASGLGLYRVPFGEGFKGLGSRAGCGYDQWFQDCTPKVVHLRSSSMSRP